MHLNLNNINKEFLFSR